MHHFWPKWYDIDLYLICILCATVHYERNHGLITRCRPKSGLSSDIWNASCKHIISEMYTVDAHFVIPCLSSMQKLYTLFIWQQRMVAHFWYVSWWKQVPGCIWGEIYIYIMAFWISVDQSSSWNRSTLYIHQVLIITWGKCWTIWVSS